MSKKILISLLVAVIFVLTGFLASNALAKNSVGWLWAGSNTNFGWISTNNANVDGKINYGLNIPENDGDVTGYTWSSNLGWVDFSPQEHCGSTYEANCTDPNGGNGGVKKENNKLTGWARIVGIAEEEKVGNSGNWDGWIKMSGDITSGGQYGIQIDSTGKFSGYSWSDELGWINFSTAKNCGVDSIAKNLVICESECGSNTPLSTITVTQGSSKNLKACLTSSANSCSGLDVTPLSTWTTGDSKVSLSGDVLKNLKGESKGNTTLNVEYYYHSLSHTLDVNVQ